MAWQLDAGHSTIEFSARHMMIAKVRGKFHKYNVQLVLDEAAPQKTTVDVSIDASSLDTNLVDRDNHLRSPDFLNVAEYPNIYFKSSQVEVLDATTAKLRGDLTIRTVSRPVVLDVEFLGRSKSPWGTTSIGFSARTKINRKDWGLEWNVALETGGWLVGEEVTIEIEAEFVQQA
jgi:polyisoprenoid-binding protein YceI